MDVSFKKIKIVKNITKPIKITSEKINIIFYGNDNKLHDIRFVHSDWENPTLGAWGLGWEVWCNGMEIIQFA